MRWEDFRSSENVEDRRGEGGGGGGGFGFPGGGAGGLGIGTIVILCIIGWVTGINPAILIGGAEQMAGGGRQREEQVDPGTQQRRRAPPADQSGQFAAKILGNTEDVWSTVLPNQTGKQYTPTAMVLYTGGTRSGCGSAQAAMGPFYCPLDKKVYLDVSFFDELTTRFGADNGALAQEYVVAHEYGHHIQDILGLLDRAQQDPQGAESGSVRTELMADCLAGVWANHAATTTDANGVTLLKPLTRQDIASALSAAAAVGDDRIQKQATGRINQDTWTHGSSAERQRWFTRGYQTGSLNNCDTFAATSL